MKSKIKKMLKNFPRDLISGFGSMRKIAKWGFYYWIYTTLSFSMLGVVIPDDYGWVYVVDTLVWTGKIFFWGFVFTSMCKWIDKKYLSKKGNLTTRGKRS